VIRSEEERRVRTALVGASDHAVTRVVAMVDAMENRAAADRLLEPLRPRLRRLRPARPLQMARLLFLPLDGAIVPDPAWRRGGATLPRGALLPITAALRRAAPDAVAAIITETEGHRFDDHAKVGSLGRRLWALAAEQSSAGALREACPATGLGDADLDTILALCLGVWRHAAALWDAMEQAEDGPPDGVVRTALAGPAREDPAVFATCLATLLRAATLPGRVSAIAAGFSPALRRLAENVLVGFIEATLPKPDAGDADPGAAAEAALRLATAIDDIETIEIWRGPEWRARLHRLRREGEATCHGIFAAGLESLVLTPFGTLAAMPDMPDAEADEVVLLAEDSARKLRRLELSARRIGDTGRYDDTTRGFLDTLATLGATVPEPASTGLRRIDLARLAEILCGREAAQRILEGA
jgi:hypothetical protein